MRTHVAIQRYLDRLHASHRLLSETAEDFSEQLGGYTRFGTAQGASPVLTPAAYAELLDARGRVVSKADLTLMLRGDGYGSSTFVSDADARAIEVHMANLRRKLGETPSQPRWIETVRGVGYRLTR